MTRRSGFLVAGVGLCAAVAIAAWLYGRDERSGRVIPVAQPIQDLEFEPPDVPTDPRAAVATILELRSHFGSVLTNSELDVATAGDDHVDPAGGPDSFDEFLWAAAGVESPPRDATSGGPLAKTSGGPPAKQHGPPTADGELAKSLRELATRLGQRAQQAQEAGDSAQRQRFSGLATLLRAEADALTSASGPAEHESHVAN